MAFGADSIGHVDVYRLLCLSCLSSRQGQHMQEAFPRVSSHGCLLSCWRRLRSSCGSEDVQAATARGAVLMEQFDVHGSRVKFSEAEGLWTVTSAQVVVLGPLLKMCCCGR